MNKPNVGDLVTIYQDPLTKQHEEGKAVLRELYRDDGEMFQMWYVHFVSDTEDDKEYMRTICIQ